MKREAELSVFLKLSMQNYDIFLCVSHYVKYAFALSAFSLIPRVLSLLEIDLWETLRNKM